jgi:ABC-type amino acid transport substrate-binding protein
MQANPMVHACLQPSCREGEADKEAMVADLRAGTYDALVLDAPVLEYTVGTNADCDLFTGK